PPLVTSVMIPEPLTRSPLQMTFAVRTSAIGCLLPGRLASDRAAAASTGTSSHRLRLRATHLESAADRRREGAVARSRRERDRREVAEVAVRDQRIGEGGDETRCIQRVEARFPPQPGDPQRASPAVQPRLDAPDELVAVQDRQDVVAPA